jgi:hypothetical protein
VRVDAPPEKLPDTSSIDQEIRLASGSNRRPSGPLASRAALASIRQF